MRKGNSSPPQLSLLPLMLSRRPEPVLRPSCSNCNSPVSSSSPAPFSDLHDAPASGTPSRRSPELRTDVSSSLRPPAPPQAPCAGGGEVWKLTATVLTSADDHCAFIFSVIWFLCEYCMLSLSSFIFAFQSLCHLICFVFNLKPC